MENFNLEVDSDGVALVTWDMPGRSMNVISAAVIEEMKGWIDAVVADDAIKGVVLTSGKDSFCAGADLEEMEGGLFGSTSSSRSEEGLSQAFETVYALNRLLRELETCGKPVAAAINGTALGGGLEVALACHYRVAADNAKAQLGLPEAKVGLMPGGGGTQRLPRLIGVMACAPLLLEGKGLAPSKALKSGIIHKVAPAGQVVAEAKRWVKEDGDPVQSWDKKGYAIPGGGPHDKDGMQNFVIGNSMLHAKTYGNYPAQKHIMSALYEGLLAPMEVALRIESRYFLKTLLRPEARNMIRTLFLSIQELTKGARRPKGVAPTNVKKLGVLGAGMMGAGIAYVSAMAGIEVVLIDMSFEDAEKGKDYSAKLLDKRIQRGRATAQKKADVLARITPTTDYALLEGADLIIEAVFEDRKIKADVTAKAEAAIPKSSIFGSNTSTLPITGLALESRRPEQFIGIHFFSPVDKMPLVEVIMAEKTNDQALAVALDYVRKIKKTPIVVNDSRGFYTSRCFGTYVREGMNMLAEGVLPALIENAGKMTGMPVAPLAMTDEVSLELSYHVQQQTKKDLGEAYEEMPGDKIVEKMVAELGRKGRKNSKGFYEYPTSGEKYLWPGLTDLAEAADEQPDVKELEKRLLYIQALETARCFEEHVLVDVRDADVGSILGWGFAPYTGGTLSLIDMIGVGKFVEECDVLAQKYGKRFAPCALLREMAEANESFYRRFNPKAAA